MDAPLFARQEDRVQAAAVLGALVPGRLHAGAWGRQGGLAAICRVPRWRRQGRRGTRHSACCPQPAHAPAAARPPLQPDGKIAFIAGVAKSGCSDSLNWVFTNPVCKEANNPSEPALPAALLLGRCACKPRLQAAASHACCRCCAHLGWRQCHSCASWGGRPPRCPLPSLPPDSGCTCLPFLSPPAYEIYDPATRKLSGDKFDMAGLLKPAFPMSTYPTCVVTPDGGLVVMAKKSAVSPLGGSRACQLDCRIRRLVLGSVPLASCKAGGPRGPS